MPADIIVCHAHVCVGMRPGEKHVHSDVDTAQRIQRYRI